MFEITSLLMTWSALALGAPAPDWGDVRGPAAGDPLPIGSYANGCLRGGVEIAKAGPGYESIRRYRKRYFAHPKMRDYIGWLGAEVKGKAWPKLMVGDLSQARGGRMRSGHRSHQIGLDMDVFFGHPKKGVKGDKAFPTLVDAKTEKTTKHLTEQRIQLLRLAASRPEVARIFVSWSIKRSLCARLAPESRGWLQKIRPWYGHDRHFHVRLSCPEGAEGCQNQKALPEGDGCGVESWFSRAEVRKRKKAAALAAASGKSKPAKTGPKVVKKAGAASEACAAVFAAKSKR